MDRSKYSLDELFLVSESDFELGGIMNPFNLMQDISRSESEIAHHFSSWPYVSRNDIKMIVYRPSLDEIFENLEGEVLCHLSLLRESQNPYILQSLTEGSFSLTALKPLQEHVFYQKTLALHLCGFGEVVLHAFNIILDKFTSKL